MNNFEKWWNGISRLAKILLAIFSFGIIGIVARIFKFVETKDASPLVGAILFFVPILGLIMWIIDIITVIGSGEFKLLYGAGSLNELVKEEKKDDVVDAEAKDADTTGEAEPEVKEEEETDTEEKA